MFNACNYNITIAEIDGCIRDVEAVFTQEEYEDLISHLSVYPESGKIIPDTGGIRKLRWRARGQGKRGGARVIYYFRDLNMPVYLLAVYAKGEKLDLTAGEKREMRELVDAIVHEKLKVKLRLISGSSA
jgi:hypothetical protein